MTDSTAVRALKRLRRSQPLNAVVTSTTRAIVRGLALRGEWAVRHLHRAGHVRCLLPNARTLRLWSRGDDGISNQVFWRGWRSYEPEMTPLFFDAASRCASVVDVGAHVGFYALLAAHANPAARVFAIEPHPLVYPRLVRNVELNATSNVICIDAAAGAAAGESELWDFAVPGIHTGGSLDPSVIRPEWEIRRWRVPVRRLDDLLAGVLGERLELLKLDIEGYEPDALLGMADRLATDRPLIFCEVLPDRQTGPVLAAMLEPLQYRFFLLTGSGVRPMARIEPDPRWYNWLFCPPTWVRDGVPGIACR